MTKGRDYEARVSQQWKGNMMRWLRMWTWAASPGTGGTWGGCAASVPSPAEYRNEVLKKGKNVFKSVNKTGQRAGIVVAYTFSQREWQVT